MIHPDDLATCKALIRDGSYSFHAASRLLPASVRDPALALYAFCRLADDAVDLQQEKAAAVLALKRRLELAYAGTPMRSAADRAFTAVIAEFDMPRALPEALIEGLAWDAMEKRYETLSDLRAYSARVASAVGAMMCVLMRVREGDALARACDLGVAMQLTNICRDVGEDARAGRLYLPLDMLRAEGITPEAFLADPQLTPGLRRVIRTLLAEAKRLYLRSEAGVSRLPLAARPGILAARHIYAAIGSELAKLNHDSIAHRARTTSGQKLFWLGWSTGQTALGLVAPQAATLYAPCLPETQFLVDAACDRSSADGHWSDDVIGIFAQLELRDRLMRAELDGNRQRPI